MSQLRQAQAAVVGHRQGPLTVAAVPGAGKTFTLTRLVARVIAEGQARPDQILMLTYMRAAAQAFRARVAEALAPLGLSARGLEATTLHAFALGVLQRQAARSGAAAPAVTIATAERWRLLAEGLDDYLSDPVRRAGWERRNPPGSSRWDDPRRLTVAAASQAIAAAKHHGLAAEALPAALAPLPDTELAWIAAHYARALDARGAIDFDDQVRLALSALERDPALREHYQARYRFVLEDEAQDATPAQRRLVALLAGPESAWVRVGDPNQAITGTFAFSDPADFRADCALRAAEGRHVTMDESSRSGPRLAALANQLVALAASHPDPAVARAFEPIAIRPAPGAPAEATVRAYAYLTPEQERVQVVSQVRAHMARHPGDRVAVLVATNQQAATYRALLAPLTPGPAPIEPAAVQACLVAVLEALDPSEGLGPRVATALAAWWEASGHVPSGRRELLHWLASDPPLDAWLAGEPATPPRAPIEDLQSFKIFARQLGLVMRERHRPPVALISLMAEALLPAEAIESADRLGALYLRQRGPSGPISGEALAAALGALEPGPAPDEPAGAAGVVVMTLHRAKGAEFDAVWLPGLGCYKLGRKGPFSAFPWHPDEANMLDERAVVVRAAVRRYARGQALEPGEALREARAEAVAERLRLLYVGLTRARRGLVLSCATQAGRQAPPFHLQALWAWISATESGKPTSV